MDKLLDIIKALIANKFYGRLEIVFENGNLVHLIKEESIKL